MKKIVAYIFSLGFFLLLTSHAFSFESHFFLVSNGLSGNTNSCQVTKSGNYVFSNTDTVIYDNDDSENINSSINKKNNILVVNTLKSVSHFSGFNCIKSTRKVYYAINFSRLPRFTFIILQVLRL